MHWCINWSKAITVIFREYDMQFEMIHEEVESFVLYLAMTNQPRQGFEYWLPLLKKSV